MFCFCIPMLTMARHITIILSSEPGEYFTYLKIQYMLFTELKNYKIR